MTAVAVVGGDSGVVVAISCVAIVVADAIALWQQWK